MYEELNKEGLQSQLNSYLCEMDKMEMFESILGAINHLTKCNNNDDEQEARNKIASANKLSRVGSYLAQDWHNEIDCVRENLEKMIELRDKREH